MRTDWQSIHVRDYGYDCRLRLVKRGVAQDVAQYTTKQLIFRSPSGQVLTKSATFATDGSDGVIAYTVEPNVITEVGDWSVQARISNDAAELTSARLIFEVRERLDA